MPKQWTDKDLRKPETWDEALTDDEVMWLEARDQHALIAANAELHGGEVPEERMTDPQQSPQTQSALDPAGRTTLVEEVLPPPVVAPEDDYDDWKVRELQAEAEKREPPVEVTPDMRKPQLIAALRKWDRDHPEALSE